MWELTTLWHSQDVELSHLCTVSAWTGTVNAIPQLGLFYLSRCNAAINLRHGTCLHWQWLVSDLATILSEHVANYLWDYAPGVCWTGTKFTPVRVPTIGLILCLCANSSRHWLHHQVSFSELVCCLLSSCICRVLIEQINQILWIRWILVPRDPNVASTQTTLCIMCFTPNHLYFLQKDVTHNLG